MLLSDPSSSLVGLNPSYTRHRSSLYGGLSPHHPHPTNMAENAPPPTTAAAPDPSRGMPYYEKLRKDLRDALQKKRILDQNLVSSPLSFLSLSQLPTDSATQASIEDSIYRLE